MLCFLRYLHHKDRFQQGFDLPSSYLIQSLKTPFSGIKGGPKGTYTCKYLSKQLNREGRSPFNFHNVREQGTTAADEEMLPAQRQSHPLTKQTKGICFPPAFFVSNALILYAFSYTLCLFSNIKSQGLEINSMIILKKGNSYSYLQFFCHVGLLIN